MADKTLSLTLLVLAATAVEHGESSIVCLPEGGEGVTSVKGVNRLDAL